MKFRTGLTAVGALWGGALCAQQQDEEGLTGKIAFGYLATSGNTENENGHLNFSGQYYAPPWRHELSGSAVRASKDDVDSAESYGLTWKSQYDINDNDYLYGVAAWNEDRFSAYERQVREVLGYGRRLVDLERQILNVEVGLGFRQAVPREGTREDESIFRLASDYTLTLSETSSFEQTVTIESGSGNTYVESISRLTADVWQDIALVLSYTVKHNTTVPPDNVGTDTFTAVSLEYSF